MPGPRSAGIVQGHDVRELRESGLLGLVVSKPDLVPFLEQMKDPSDVRRMETAVDPGVHVPLPVFCRAL